MLTSFDLLGAIVLFIDFAQWVCWGNGIRVASVVDIGQVNVLIDLTFDSHGNLAWCGGVDAVFNVAKWILLGTSTINNNSFRRATLEELRSSFLSTDEFADSVVEFSCIACWGVPSERQRVGGFVCF